MALSQAVYERFRQPIYEFTKFAVVGIAGVFITNASYGLLYLHYRLGPVLSITIATIVAAVATFLGNRYWSFRNRERTGVSHEIIIFAVLNGIGLLIQDATVAFNYYLLGLGHDKLAVFVALNLGIAIATGFRFWSYRQFVWGAAKRGSSSAARSTASRRPTRPSCACRATDGPRLRPGRAAAQRQPPRLSRRGRPGMPPASR